MWAHNQVCQTPGTGTTARSARAFTFEQPDCQHGGQQATAKPPPVLSHQRSLMLGPISDDELADQMEAWQLLTAWRDKYDSGLRPPPFPGERRPAVLERITERAQRQPPPDARLAIPEWRLDRNRSFAGRLIVLAGGGARPRCLSHLFKTSGGAPATLAP
jgi:hypothetical protein